MQSLEMLFVFFLISVLASSCSSMNDFEEENIAKNITSKTDIIKLRLLSLGFDTLDVKDVGEYYVVENDILVNKKLIENHLETRQFTADYVVPTGASITISTDNTISEKSGWIDALKEVISIYHENADLDFIYVDPNSASDITISKSFLQYENVCAVGEFPSATKKPGSYVYINTGLYKDIDSYLTHNQKVFLLMHEIGHNLGLRHTDCKINNEISNKGMHQVPDTPESDENSFMNSKTCGKSWNGITYYDKITFAHLWPYSYTVHFENADVDDIVVKQQRKYYVSRYLIPERQGFVFSGWMHTLQAYSPFCYNQAISSDKTLYAAWHKTNDLITKSVYSGEGEQSIEFTLTSATPISITSTVSKALNTWYELRNADGTYSKLEKIDNVCTFTKIIDMRNDEMWTSDDNKVVSRSETFMLEAGKYRLTSSMTTKLGDQNNTPSGKHGSVNTIVTY